MARQYHDPTDKHFSNYYVIATKSTFSVCRLSWVCPDCGARNHSDFDGARISRTDDWKIRSRCGKCHSNTFTLLDAQSREIDPLSLLPTPPELNRLRHEETQTARRTLGPLPTPPK